MVFFCLFYSFHMEHILSFSSCLLYILLCLLQTYECFFLFIWLIISSDISILISLFTLCLFLSLIKYSINFSASSWLIVENISKNYFLEECNFRYSRGSNLNICQCMLLILLTSFCGNLFILRNQYFFDIT